MQEMELHVHYLCPYAQRALYVKAFKNINCQIIEQDLSIKSPSLYNINPLGKVPSLLYIRDGRRYKLYESIQVCQFLDSFPGPSLYPKIGDIIDPLAKAQIDMALKNEIDVFVSAFIPFWWKTPTEKDKQFALKVVSIANKRVQGGRYYMTEELGDVLTMADIALFPFVERIWALKESFLSEMVEGLNLSSLWQWYHRMISHVWIQQYLAPAHRLRKVLSLIKENKYPGLALPVTIYDQ
ncbi:hypothetical protein SteCoe_33588 [Stentor coeruleus]|uniref:GST N-terminal domain-containing protein n=1 Tax=Stentor coeruleus TaxID=5963 RepID=A0A1R2AWS9_9CILI|nr:hypothetical protein SteCoe_33588 [Stentor coeruleus]